MQEEFDDQYENQQINEEYKIWKKNSPFLYDLVISHELEWPSLTVQWLPMKDHPPQADYDIHKLILGTHTSDAKKEPNYLMIAKVRLPIEETITDISEYQQQATGVGGIGQASGENRIDIETKIVHEGEINKARYMPQKCNIIATKTVSGEVHIFDYTQHPTKPNDLISKPQLRCAGHTAEGYGLSWSNKREGYLLSGSNDELICLWDIEAQTEMNKQVQPLHSFKSHKGSVEDVSWHRFNESWFGSCGDDRVINLWDIREPKPVRSFSAHMGEIYSLDFSPFQENIFLSGSQDKTIGFWDLRNTQKRLHTFEGHTDDVVKVEWAPFNVAFFASCSADRRIIVWDITKIGQELKPEDAVDGPAEMLFLHGGHRAKVPDLAWNQNDQFVIASVEEENNFLQVWQMADSIVEEDEQGLLQQQAKHP